MKIIKTDEKDKVVDIEKEQWSVEKNIQNVPEGLWGTKVAQGKSPPISSDTLKNQLV
jgi:hypothetical protein